MPRFSLYLHLIFVLSLSFLASTSVWAQSDPCSDINLTAQGFAAYQVPITSQSSFGSGGFQNPGSCTAHAATTMVRSYANTQHISYNFTPEEIFSLITDEHPEARDINTGRTCNAINLIRQVTGDQSIPECSNFGFRAETHQLLSPNDFELALNNRLNQSLTNPEALPVGIEYCSAVLRNDGEYIINRNFRSDLNYLSSGENENFDPDCGFHASVVVGRKRINGQCHFLVQNSYGRDCKAYDPNTRECNEGRVYVPASQLMQNTFRLVFFN